MPLSGRLFDFTYSRASRANERSLSLIRHSKSGSVSTRSMITNTSSKSLLSASLLSQHQLPHPPTNLTSTSFTSNIPPPMDILRHKLPLAWARSDIAAEPCHGMALLASGLQVCEQKPIIAQERVQHETPSLRPAHLGNVIHRRYGVPLLLFIWSVGRYVQSRRRWDSILWQRSAEDEHAEERAVLKDQILSSTWVCSSNCG